MNYQELTTKAKHVPGILQELGERIHNASQEDCTREQFYNWFDSWYQNASHEVQILSSEFRALEEAALEKCPESLIERQAIKDAVDMEDLFNSLSKDLNCLSKSIQSNMRFGNIWKYWSSNLTPYQKKVDHAVRKFRIATAGL